jgi:hypothetical protein
MCLKILPLFCFFLLCSVPLAVRFDLQPEVRKKFEIRDHIPARLKIERSYSSNMGRRPLDGILHIPSARIRGHYFPVPSQVKIQGYIYTPPPELSGQYKDSEPIRGLRYYRGRRDRHYRFRRGDAEEIFRAYRVHRTRYLPMTRPSVKDTGVFQWPVDWPPPDF